MYNTATIYQKTIQNNTKIIRESKNKNNKKDYTSRVNNIDSCTTNFFTNIVFGFSL